MKKDNMLCCNNVVFETEHFLIFLIGKTYKIEIKGKYGYIFEKIYKIIRNLYEYRFCDDMCFFSEDFAKDFTEKIEKEIIKL